ncbi:nuclear transport factor 2 family protein [Pseudoteredinibacter isoporae]|uniref:nuclear transport factor 2 family protein n=1 Tax=Pseudoteredinibacter isoporae TaxID=570281 RepID=UPI003107DFB5
MVKKTMRIMMLFCAVTFTGTGLAEGDAYKDIHAVLNDYTQGTYLGDRALLESVFHPSAVMNGYLGKQLMISKPAQFIADVVKMEIHKAKTPYSYQVTSISIDGKVASVVLTEAGFPGNMAFTNYFHLIDDGHGWKIISKTFIGKADAS